MCVYVLAFLVKLEANITCLPKDINSFFFLEIFFFYNLLWEPIGYEKLCNNKVSVVVGGELVKVKNCTLLFFLFELDKKKHY